MPIFKSSRASRIGPRDQIITDGDAAGFSGEVERIEREKSKNREKKE